ncbi:MAG TPA: ComEA family DNA-binding protein [Kocuria rosea]|nr:ComEA family DNA-binding protein [Kocuria rosea]
MTGTVHPSRRRPPSAEPAQRTGPPEPTGRTGPGGSPPGRLSALLAEASARAPAAPGPAPSGTEGPAHRWHVAARTRVPRSLLLLVLAALAVPAWAVLGPGSAGDAAPGAEPGEGPALAEVEAPGSAPGAPPVPAAPGGSAPPGAGPSASPGAGPSAAPSPGGTLLVHVTGEVARPGVVEVEPGDRVVDAVEAAGGLTGAAVTEGVNLAAPVADGQQVLIPDTRPAPPPAAPGTPDPATDAGAASADGAGLLDLNTATAADLEALPRVGPVLAERIVAFREQNGGFASVADLDAVEGVGPALMEALTPLVTV